MAVQALPARVGAPREESVNLIDDDDATQATAAPGSPKEGAPTGTPNSAGRSRGRGGAAMGSDEWTRQRKDNHVGIFPFPLPALFLTEPFWTYRKKWNVVVVGI